MLPQPPHQQRCRPQPQSNTHVAADCERCRPRHRTVLSSRPRRRQRSLQRRRHETTTPTWLPTLTQAALAATPTTLPVATPTGAPATSPTAPRRRLHYNAALTLPSVISSIDQQHCRTQFRLQHSRRRRLRALPITAPTMFSNVTSTALSIATPTNALDRDVNIFIGRDIDRTVDRFNPCRSYLSHRTGGVA